MKFLPNFTEFSVGTEFFKFLVIPTEFNNLDADRSLLWKSFSNPVVYIHRTDIETIHFLVPQNM